MGGEILSSTILLPPRQPSSSSAGRAGVSARILSEYLIPSRYIEGAARRMGRISIKKSDEEKRGVEEEDKGIIS